MPARPPGWTPSVGLNLSGVADWSTDHPFLDRMLTHRDWIPRTDVQWGTGQQVVLGPQNWPAELPAGSFLTTVLGADPHGVNPTGRYVVTWEGSGEISVSWTALMVEGDGTGGQAVIWAPGDPNADNPDYNPVFLNILASDPADPVRNIRVVREDQMALFEAGETFNPAFLEQIQDFRSLRFMDFGHTNNSPVETWEDRPRPDDASWAWYGVPVEAMVELANRTGTDPWFCMPHMADDDYIRRFAEYVRDNLDPRLVAHVEFSNEAWNWQFWQSHHAMEQANARWAVDADGSGAIDPWEAADHGWMQWNGMRAAQMAQIWTETFGDETATRLERVIATQTAWLGLEEYLLNAPLWVAEGNPEPWTFFDSYAITTYFNGSLYEPEHLATVFEWAAMGEAGLDLAFQQLRHADLLPDSWGLEDAAFLYDYHAEVAQQHGLRLVAYEGGQHLVSTTAPGLTDFFTALVNDPRMGELYARNMDMFRAAGGTLFEHFASFGYPSVYGHWGMLDTVYEEGSPRWDATQAWNDANPAWWEDRDPRAFANGQVMLGDATAETMQGGDGGDRLVGGGGDDLLNGRLGSDTVRGGEGADRLNGMDGADHLHGEAGDDRLSGGNDRDTLTGGAGGDTLNGGAGNDRLDGGEDGDGLLGALGQDTLLGGDGQDTLDGGAGNDLLEGGDGNDRLSGLDGADLLEGGAGDDRLAGGNAADTLGGGAGRDTLDAGAGDDLLDGGEGADRLRGGDGADIFVLAEAGHSPHGAGLPRDVVMDFQSGLDLVRLDLDADETADGVQDFVLVEAFAANQPGQVRVVALAADRVVLLGNTDADAAAEFAIEIRGTGSLGLADLVL